MDTGYLVELASIQSDLATNIVRLLKDENLQRKLGENGIKRVEDKRIWQRAAEVRLSLYNEMLKETALV